MFGILMDLTISMDIYQILLYFQIFFFKVMKWFSFYMTCCNYQMLLYFSILFIKKGSFDFVLK